MKYRMTRRGPVQEFTLRPYSNTTSKDEVYCQGPHCISSRHIPIVNLEEDVSPTRGISVKEYKSPMTFLNRSHYKPNSPRLRFKDDGTRRIFLSDHDLEKNSEMLLSDDEYDSHNEVNARPQGRPLERPMQRPAEWENNEPEFQRDYDYHWEKPLEYSLSDQDYRVLPPRNEPDPPERPQDAEYPKNMRYPELKRSFSTSPHRNMHEAHRRPKDRVSFFEERAPSRSPQRKPIFEERAPSRSPQRKPMSPLEYVRETPLSPKEETLPLRFARGRTHSPTRPKEPMPRLFFREPLSSPEETSPHEFARERTRSPSRPKEPIPHRFFHEPRSSPKETASPHFVRGRTRSPSQSKEPSQFLEERTPPQSAPKGTASPHHFERGHQSPTYRPKDSDSPYRLERTRPPVAQNGSPHKKRALSPFKQTGPYYEDIPDEIAMEDEDYSVPPSREMPSNSKETSDPTGLDSPTYGMVKVTHSSPDVHPSHTPVRNVTPEKPKPMDKELLRIKEEIDPLKKQMVELHRMLKKEEKPKNPKKKVQIRQPPLSAAPSQLYPKINTRFPSAAELVEEFSKRFVAGTKATRGKIVNSERNLKDFNQNLSRVPSSSRYHKSCIHSPEAVTLKKDKT